MKDRYVPTEEHKRKISESHKGIRPSEETKRKISESKKGKPGWWKDRKRGAQSEEHKKAKADKLRGRKRPDVMTDEVRAKISLASQGRVPWNAGKTGVYSEETRQSMSLSRKGKSNSPRTQFTKGTIPWNKDKPLPHLRGENSPVWKGGITKINHKIRGCIEYKIWRRAVLERDGFVCIIGGFEHGERLEVDHIKSFAGHPELRFEVSNGRTLCHQCHKQTDTYGSKSRTSNMSASAT